MTKHDALLALFIIGWGLLVIGVMIYKRLSDGQPIRTLVGAALFFVGLVHMVPLLAMIWRAAW